MWLNSLSLGSWVAWVRTLTLYLLLTFKKLLEKTEICDSFDDLESTFYNSFNKIKCDLCDFKAKDERGLKIHERRKRTNPLITVNEVKRRMYNCEECDFVR